VLLPDWPSMNKLWREITRIRIRGSDLALHADGFCDCENLVVCRRCRPAQPKNANRQALFDACVERQLGLIPFSKRARASPARKSKSGRLVRGPLAQLRRGSSQSAASKALCAAGRRAGPEADPGRTRANRAPDPRLERKSRSLFGESRQHQLRFGRHLLFEISRATRRSFPRADH